MSKMLAGAAKRCITPNDDMLKKFAEQNGPRESFDGVYDDIFVRVIAVSDGSRKVLLISADLMVFPGQEMLSRRLEEEFGIEPYGCIFGVTHNHEAPMAGFKEGDDFNVSPRPATDAQDEYSRFVHEQTVSAVKEAIESLVPARMGVNSGQSYINCNRDLATPIGPIQANDWHGPADHELLVIQFEDLNGGIIGMYVNHATHSNMACWNLYNGDFKKIQGDFGGGVSRFVEKANKNKFPVLWVMGAAGDQSPFVRSKLRSVDVDDDGNFSVIESYFTIETVLKQLQYIVCTQGLEVLELSEKMTEYTDEFSFTAAETWRGTAARKPYRDMKIEPACGERPQPQLWRFPVVPHRMRLAVLNGVAYAMMNGEIYSRIGTQIKEVLPVKHTAIVSMAYGMLSYIPDAEREWVNGFGTVNTIAASGVDTERAFKEGYAELMEKTGLA